MIISFCLCLLAFVIVGLLSTLRARHNSADYLLAGQSVPPWLVALSAVATNNSGYMFIGMIGYTYLYGLSSIWLMIGWVFGDFLASLVVHKPLRRITEARNVLSYSGAISHWFHHSYPRLRALCGLITVIFLGIYAAAQLKAGSKALTVLFGWDDSLGAIIGAIIVLLYCFAGGIRASIWTDAAQSFVMFMAMTIMFVISLYALQDSGGFISQLHTVSPTYMNLFPENNVLGPWLGPILFVSGWILSGFGVIGQPHIMVRFMTMRDVSDMGRVRIYYYFWFSTFFGLTILTALCARLLLPDAQNFDAELALPLLAIKLLPAPVVGLVLAGLFAATMSTADSQILSCSAALTRDFTSKPKQSFMLTKLATVFVTLSALGIALSGNQTVFSLVLIAWSALACAFGPLLGLYAFNQKLSETVSILTVIFGLSVMIGWRAYGLNETLYEVFPGMVCALIPWIISKLFNRSSA